MKVDNGEHALKILRSGIGIGVDLLLSDVVMRGPSPQMAKEAKRILRRMAVLLEQARQHVHPLSWPD